MSLRLEHIRLDVLTGKGPLGYETEFGSGLNVLRAPNSYGKSTLLQSIIYALGLEGMMSASSAPPLGPIMTTVADLPDSARAAVIDSSVTLTISNESGRYLRVRRFVRSTSVDARLIQTWSAASLADLGTAPQIDMYVRMGGAAVQELGFHRMLASFLGWSLPMVPTFREGERPLYLETLFPLFYVEQKAGWAGVTPRMPTYLGIRDMLRRSVEYVLGLSALDRIRALTAIREEIAAVRVLWTSAVDRAQAAAAAESLRLLTPATAITGLAQRSPTQIEAGVDGNWSPLSEQLSGWEARLAILEANQVALAGERTPQSQRELAEAERDVRRLGGQLRIYSEQATYLEADLDALSARIEAVEADRRRLQDLQRVRTLGSDLSAPLLSDDLCPTCFQLLDDRHVATGEAASLEATLQLGAAERATLLDMRSAAEQRGSDLSRARDALTQQLSHARGQVRLLRDELVSPSNTPSLVEVREQLWLKARIEGAQRVQALLRSIDDELDRLAASYDDLRARLSTIEGQAISPQDRALLNDFNRRFREQLEQYGLVSLPVSQVSIDEDSLIPIDDGIELRFDIAIGMSASDTIRTKWAYYVALLEAASQSRSGHHARLLMFDEPRQQETAKVSLAALIRRLGAVSAQGNQILYATSEDPDVLDQYLDGIPHTELAAKGTHLLWAYS